MNNLRRLLRSKRGSISASIIFVMFSAVTMTAVMGMVLTTMNGSSSAREYSNASADMALKKAAYQGSVIGGATVDCAPGNETCAGSESLGDGLTAVTMSAEVRGGTVKQTNTLRGVDANYIAGYDVSGNPIWVTETGTRPHQFREITSKGGFTCSIDVNKNVWCWGDNVNGQLGNGSTSDSYEPAQIAAPSGGAAGLYTKLSNGTSYSMCALTDAGLAYCWGNNSHGQMGVDPALKQSVSTPVQMTAAGSTNKFTEIVQSATTTCAIEKTTTKIWCWGENNGDSKPASTHVGTAVAGAGKYVKLAMDRNTACGLDTTSRIQCWSANGLGQVGLPLESDGTVKLAGYDGTAGSMGITTAMYIPSSPVIIPAGQDKSDPGTLTPVTLPGQWKDVVIGDQEQDFAKSVVCGIKTNETAWCWGDNDHGQLGGGSTVKTDSEIPVPLATDRKFKSLAISPETVCGVDTTNHVLCWGNNDYGQLGNGSAMTSSDKPVEIDKHTTYQDSGLVAASGNKKWFCGLTTGTVSDGGRDLGEVKCWGRNSFGQMANGTTSSVTTPLTIGGYPEVGEVTIGDHHACLADKNMVTTCWGRNTSGEAGTGLRSAGDTGYTAPAGVKETPFVYPGYDGFVNGGRE